MCAFKRTCSSPTVTDGCYQTLSGPFPIYSDYLRRLEHLDISANDFTGHVDVLLYPSLISIDVSNNKFTTAGFRRFHESFHSLKEVDLSSNLISQDVSELLLNIPPALEDCDFSNNDIFGILPKDFPLAQVLFFSMSNNRISGPLPDFPSTSRKLKHLVLANNHLTGTIHDDFFKLDGLNVLDLSGNELSGSIPAGLGDLTQLSTLKLSSNSLGESVPIKLMRLKGKWSHRCTRFKCVSNTNLGSNCKIYLMLVQTCQKYLTCRLTHLLEPFQKS